MYYEELFKNKITIITVILYVIQDRSKIKT